MRCTKSILGQTRVALALGASLGMASFWSEVFRRFAEGDTGGALAEAGAGWPVHLCIGTGGFLLMVAPGLAGVGVQWRLVRRLKGRPSVPMTTFDSFPWSGRAAALTAVAVISVALPMMFYRVVYMATLYDVESLVLPQAMVGRENRPLQPQLVLNVMKDGVVRVHYVSYWDEQVVDALARHAEQECKTWRYGQPWATAQEAAPCRDWQELRRLIRAELDHGDGPGGHSKPSVHVRADAFSAWHHVNSLLEVCRELGVERVSFGVAPKCLLRSPHVSLDP